MTVLSLFMRYGGPKPLGGVFGLNTLLPLETQYMNLTQAAKDIQGQTPMLLYNGLADQTIQIKYARKSRWIFTNYVYVPYPENL